MVTVYSVLVSIFCAVQGSKSKTGGSSSVTPHFMSQQPGFEGGGRHSGGSASLKSQT